MKSPAPNASETGNERAAFRPRRVWSVSAWRLFLRLFAFFVRIPSLPLARRLSPFPPFTVLGSTGRRRAGRRTRRSWSAIAAQGEPAWKEALPMRYNPIPKTDEDLADYRGSIVHLDAGHHLRSPTDPGRHADHRQPDGHDLERGVSRSARRSASATATRRWRSPSRARPGLAGLRRPGRDDRRAPPARRLHHDQRLVRDPPRLHAQGRRARPTPLPGGPSAPSGSRAATTSSSRTATSPTGAGSIPTTGFGFDYDAAIFSRSTDVEAAHRPALQAAPSDVRRQHLVRAEVSHAHDGAAVHHAVQHRGQPRHPLQRVLVRPGAHVQRRHRRRQQRQLPRLARARLGHLRQPRQPLLGRRPGGRRRQPQRARLGQLHHAVHDDDRQRARLHRPALHLAQRGRAQPIPARRRRREFPENGLRRRAKTG